MLIILYLPTILGLTFTTLVPWGPWIAIGCASSPISLVANMNPVGINFCRAPVTIIFQSTSCVCYSVVHERENTQFSCRGPSIRNTA